MRKLQNKTRVGVPQEVVRQAMFIRRSIQGCTGNCARASFRLYKWCIDAGYRAHFVVGVWDYDCNGAEMASATFLNHAWVALDGWIIDITAGQFTDEYGVAVLQQSKAPQYTPFLSDKRALANVYKKWPKREQPSGIAQLLAKA